MSQQGFDILATEAVARERLHAGQATSRPLSPGYEYVGLKGEEAFSKEFGLPMDLARRPEGNGRVNFVVDMRFSVDVVTARIPANLICEEGKVTSDIYVLAQFFEDRDAELLGWEWGGYLVQAPVKDLGYGIPNHCIPRDKLRPMAELHVLMRRFR